MIYRFEADDHGVVIAEEKEAHLESYLGLHFPVIDIPLPARTLFLRNWTRQIPDVNYAPVRLVPPEAFPDEHLLDLSNCVSRGVSRYHIEYLQNMGVAGSLTISLIDEHHLWGLIACHHYTPKQVDYETRRTCELLGQFASIELVHQQERALEAYRTQVETIQTHLRQAFLREPNFIQQVLTHHATELLDLGNMHLCPRQSFELWKETVQDTSLPWQTVEIEAARMMRNTLMLAVLEFSQIALEQAAERAAIANRAKSQFLAKMSHELRTPLNAILGFAQMMNHSPNIPAEFQEPVSIINRSGEHLLTLINDVLEMSRIEAGQLVLTEQHFNLHRLLQSLKEMFALKAAQKGLTLLFEEDPNVPRYVCSDAAKLRQILINLISNAIKFTAQGGVLVRVSATPIQAAKRGCTCYSDAMPTCQSFNLSFIVKGTGCGIDHRDWDSIFEAFMQTERGRHAEGTGLGLCISRQFARLMGGDITVQSTVNQGSTFTCQITLYQPEAIALLEPETGQAIARHISVRYRYSHQSQISPMQRSVVAQDLQLMPVSWIAQVHEASLDLRDEQLYQLIAQIPDTNQWLIQSMNWLVDTLQFEAIASLTRSQEDIS